MKENVIGHLVKTNPIKPNFKRGTYAALWQSFGEKKEITPCHIRSYLYVAIAGAGFEPATSGLWARRATRLLYPAAIFRISYYKKNKIAEKIFFIKSKSDL